MNPTVGFNFELAVWEFIGTITTEAEKNEHVLHIFVMLGATVWITN